ncbi:MULTISPECIES: hypothetical protein [Burkholderia]|uniref:hypothetical protein n=1 Tax=Burkholderia TaxID=32008 RepID=UPI0007592737|nr:MULTISPECIES: hypothetical protein [Burkholderia]KVF08982.1 hypothetical protein WJ04_09125 [Burkholderia vietnamiensis]MCA8239860.1 hypothetical protein [Burkholderia sp. AU32262]
MAGTSTLTGSGWIANGQPRSDESMYGVPYFTGKPQDGVGKNGDLTIDPVARKIYEKVAGAWSAGTSY